MENSISANAKINIGLNIVRRREDGYHDIETIFYPVKIADRIVIRHGMDTNLACFAGDDGKPMEIAGQNTIDTAFALLKARYDIPALEVELYKRIPMGAGMGGGSADAAFFIRAVNEAFRLGMTTKQMEDMAAKIGSDCAFFIENTPKFATGRGEVLTPVPSVLDGYVIKVIKPRFNISTKEAYSKVKPMIPKTSLVEDFKRPVREWQGLIKNDFEASVFPEHPELQRYNDLLYESGALYASMTGSGSALFGIFDHEPVLRGEIAELMVD